MKIYIKDPHNITYKGIIIFSDYDILFNLYNTMLKYQKSLTSNITKEIIKTKLINKNNIKNMQNNSLKVKREKNISKPIK